MLYRRLVIFFLKCATYKSTYLLTYLLTYLTLKFRSMFYLAGLGYCNASTDRSGYGQLFKTLYNVAQITLKR